MSYADSAIDYSYRIAGINVDQQLMTIEYFTDSSDTARPSVYRNVALTPSQFNDSDIQVLAEAQGADVVTQWDEIIEANAANPTFNDSDFIGDTYSTRYKPHVIDSEPSFNPLTHKLVSSDSEGYDEIRTSYTVTAMSDSEKGDYRSSLLYSKKTLWTGLMEAGRLDSAVSALGLYTGSHDSAEIDFIVGDVIFFDADVLAELRTTLNINDSDFAALI